eukprot:TRINITY_DN11962_c0_g1_i1.p1 TRINITY_DN11962_c0_g1~~TRINITY_DN11962_c0_g1_i1.p1  ORF type:complete len:420 (+),score=72.77 TRINITY_DN11962_c0_g1_i1:59-1318(+)
MPSPFQIGLVNVLGGLIVGYCTIGIVGTSSKPLNRYFGVDQDQLLVGVGTSSVVVGSIIGAYLAGLLTSRVGRRITSFIGCGLTIYGHALCFGPDYWTLNVIRLVLGAGAGILSVVCPMYVSETATEKKGQLGTLFQLAITFGILLGNLLGFGIIQLFKDDPNGDFWNWRIMIGIGVIFPIMLTVLTYKVIRDQPSNQNLSSPAEILFNEDESSAQGSGWSGLIKYNFKLLITGLVLVSTLQLTGINAIMYFGPSIINSAGIGNEDLVQVGIGAWNFITTFVSVFLIERLGRRTLIIGGTCAIALSLIEVGLSIAYLQDMSKAIGVGVGLAVFIAGFEGGIGSLFWVLVNEIYPPNVKEAGSSFATIMNYVFTLIITLFYLQVAKSIQPENTFYIFGGVGILCTVYFVFALPDSRKEEH